MINSLELSHYQNYIIKQINLYEQSNKCMPELINDLLYSLRNNPYRFNDYQQILKYYLMKGDTNTNNNFMNQLIIQKYLLNPIPNDKQLIISNIIYNNFINKYSREPDVNQLILYKNYIFKIQKPIITIDITNENFLIPFNEHINIILSASSQTDIKNKINDYLINYTNISINNNNNNNSNNLNNNLNNSNNNNLNNLSNLNDNNNNLNNNNIKKYNIPIDIPNYDFIIKVLNKGYKYSWNLLIEYIVNNISLLQNANKMPTKLIYKNENIGNVYSSLTKILSVNSQYRPFKSDIIEILNSLHIYLIGINYEMISATPFLK